VRTACSVPVDAWSILQQPPCPFASAGEPDEGPAFSMSADKADPLSMNSVMTSVEDPKPQLQLVLDEPPQPAQQLNGSSAARMTQRHATTVRIQCLPPF